MIKKLSALSLAASALAFPAFAKVSFSLDIEALTAANGTTNLSNSGLLVLVVDTAADGFAGPSAGALASGNDEVVATWDLSKVGPGTADITLLTEGGVAWDADWSANDSLALYWFPGLSESNMSPAADEVYGVFADAASLASGDTWKMPADGTLLHSLKLFTAAATKLVIAGDFPQAIGKAAFSVTTPPQLPVAPSSVAATPNGNLIDLSWTGGSSAGGGFIVQRTKSGQAAWQTIGFASDGSSAFADDMVSAGFQYEYRLIAANGLNAATNTLSSAIQAERSVLASVAARSLMESALPRRMYGQVDVVGDDPKKNVIIQASGPWLAGKIIGAPVQDPSMELYTHPNLDFNDRVAVSLDIDNWMEQGNALSIDQVQADFGSDVNTRRVNTFAESSKDASWLGQVNSGNAYTFAVNSKDGSEGPVHIGIYNAEKNGTQFAESNNRIVALATRGYLGTAIGHKMFGEFTIEGNVKKTVLIRGLGPNLANFPPLNDGSELRAVVEDPSITLYYHPNPVADISDRTEIAYNDNWETQIASSVVISDMSVIRAAEQYVLDFDPRQVAFASGSKDALLLVNLDPGVYTFLLNAPGTGIGLLGIYEVELEM